MKDLSRVLVISSRPDLVDQIKASIPWKTCEVVSTELPYGGMIMCYQAPVDVVVIDSRTVTLDTASIPSAFRKRHNTGVVIVVDPASVRISMEQARYGDDYLVSDCINPNTTPLALLNAAYKAQQNKQSPESLYTKKAKQLPAALNVLESISARLLAHTG